MTKLTYEYLRKNNLILFEVVSGSTVYGTTTIDSDLDRRYVYILPNDHILSGKAILDASDDSNDVSGFEISKFVELLYNANPNAIEMIFTPDEFVLYMDDAFSIIRDNRKMFLTKRCEKTFSGYAITQIKKARGQDKMQNWEANRVERKTVLDFCYFIDGEKSYSLTKWLEEEGREQKFCGIVKIPNARDMYAVYYDYISHYCFSESLTEEEREKNKSLMKSEGNTFLGYKGIVIEKDGEESNEIRLSSIPKGEVCLGVFSYNKDGYSSHCKDYKKYKEWQENRNDARWIDVKSHGQKIDGKNMLHCVRLIDLALGIAKDEVVLRGERTEYLLRIKKGLVDLETIISDSESRLEQLSKAFEESDLADELDMETKYDMILSVRNSFWNEQTL